MSEEQLGRYAVVVDGLAVNVIVWDGSADFDPGDDAVLIELADDGLGGIGWTYNPKATKHKWVAPPEVTDGDD